MWLRRTAMVMGCALIAAGLSAVPAHAAPPAGFEDSLVVGAGLTGPSGFDIAPDGRIFVLEREGMVKIVKNGQLLAQPFADLPSAATGDRGLIGIAFDPGFGVANNYVYFYYTGLDLLNHLVRFDALGRRRSSGPVRDLLDADAVAVAPRRRQHRLRTRRQAVSRRRRQRLPPERAGPHQPVRQDTAHQPRRLDSRPTTRSSASRPTLGAIWAYGFRNPWRFQFDPATGQLYGGDVGDSLVGGTQPHRRRRQLRLAAGRRRLHRQLRRADRSDLHLPAQRAERRDHRRSGLPRHDVPGRSTGAQLFFGDYAQGFIKTAQLSAGGGVTAVNVFDSAAGTVVDLKVAPDGSLYYLTIFPGELHRVTYDTTSHPPIAERRGQPDRGRATADRSVLLRRQQRSRRQSR